MSVVILPDPPTVCRRCEAPMGEDADPVLHPTAGARHMYRCLNGHTVMGGLIEAPKTMTEWSVCAGCDVVRVPIRGQLCGRCRRRGSRYAAGSEEALATAARRRCPGCGKAKGPDSKTCRACRPGRRRVVRASL